MTISGHFFRQLHNNLAQNLGSDDHFEVLKSYNIILVGKKILPENRSFLALSGLLIKLELLLLLNFAHCHFYLRKSLLSFLFATAFYLGIRIFASNCNSNMSTL